MKVLQFPLVKPTVCFIAGIAAAHILAPQTAWVLWTLLPVLASCCLFYALRRTNLFGAFLLAVMTLLGAGTYVLHDATRAANRFTLFSSDTQPHTATLTVLERLRPSAKRERYYAKVHRLDGQVVSGKLLLHIPKPARQLAVGTLLQIHTPLRVPGPARNPGQFDYGTYLRNKGVLAQAFPQPWEIRVGQPKKDIRYYAGRLRDRIIHNLKSSGLDGDALAIVSALILGQQQDISREINEAYQFAGAVHILSVSGLHVGFILMFLNAMLAFLPNTRHWRRAKWGITILSLWAFAFVAGCAPSVVRSVTMFSFMATGQYLRRGSNSFHTLWVSMLLILLFEPAFLFDVGFQLSYLALFFILWLDPLLQQLWEPRFRITTYCWRILTVSVAAQLGTLPLSLFYFHQFPGLFFLTNLVVLPMLTVLMALGVFHAVLAVFTAVPAFWLWPMKFGIGLLNGIIAGIASVESFLFRELPFNLLLTLTAYLALVFLVRWMEKPQFTRLVALGVGILLMQVTWLQATLQTSAQKDLYVLSQYKSSAIVLRRPDGLVLMTDSLAVARKNITVLARERFTKIASEQKIPNVLLCRGRRILILDRDGICPTGAQPEVLLIRQSPKINLDRLLQKIKPRVIVADGSNFKSYAALWDESCRKHGVRFHNTAQDGFWSM